MSDTPPPQCVNIRKAVTREAHYEGRLGAAQLTHFEDVLAQGRDVALTYRFGRDDEDRQVVDLTLEGRVEMQCQRCLQPVELSVKSGSRLGLVLTDEQARSLPKAYEPWIAIDEVDLWAMAGEELALALPVVAYHAEGECEAPETPQESAPQAEPEQKQNPFDVLSSLLEGEDEQETE